MSLIHEGHNDVFGPRLGKRPPTEQAELLLAMMSALRAAERAAMGSITHEEQIVAVKTWGGLVKTLALSYPDFAKSCAQHGMNNGTLRREAETLYPELKGTWEPPSYRRKPRSPANG